MTVQEYIDKIHKRYITGISREHSYRGDLQNLLESMAPEVTITNEPARVACGAPDYIITRKNIPVGYIEAKDIGADLNSKVNKEQFDRYRQSLNNLIITDYLTFQLYIDGAFVTTISIGEIHGNKIIAKPENFTGFTDLIKNFCIFTGQTIKSASKLSRMMAGKARLLANVIEKALEPDITSGEINEPQNLNLHNQYESFKQILIHDITPKTFADIYAQTIAYGMFAARLHDPCLENFSRQEAAELIPKSNPFLRKLFQYIAGYDLDDRIKWIVDALADIFRATNVQELLKDFGKSTQQHDPIIHFYETFLSEYDPALRKSRGVWYTPEPVVNFIVRAVDDILKSEFNLPQGLADTSKIKIKVSDQGGKPVEKEVHRVQILDPAAGTGTFLAEVIKQIYRKFEGQQGIWSQYVDDHLIPRLNGFEILMASYAMAHLKLDMLLTETGYKPNKEQRLKIYLTNSLEEHHPDTGTLFANWLSTEANEANHVKRDTPVMIILGNPPYSVSSSNKSKWIEQLMLDYKKNLNEKNIQPLSDDYIKFIRYGQYFITKTGEGILAFISNNSFLDGSIHRQMRKNLLEIFDRIYILNLHGSSKKREVSPNGSSDQNVFDIMQGVSINIFITSSSKDKKHLPKVFYSDLYGIRAFKYETLLEQTISTIEWNSLPARDPNYYFINKDISNQEEYMNGFKIEELFLLKNIGIATGKDQELVTFNPEEVAARYSETAVKYSYRPFDSRYTIFDKKLLQRARYDTMQHLILPNISMQLTSLNRQLSVGYFFISNTISDRHLLDSAGDSMSVFPLYIYLNSKNNEVSNNLIREPNLNHEIVNRISILVKLNYVPEKASDQTDISPIDILDYIYAVLHSPIYRSRYKEFLKIDFPRVPYPKDADIFWQLVKLGGELRQIHLLESPNVNKFITTYPVNGSNEVVKLRYEDDKVWIAKGEYYHLRILCIIRRSLLR
jgi:predicted helicase